MKNAQIVAAGPLIVIDTEVLGLHKSNPEYNFLASLSEHMFTPEFPTLPNMSGL